MDAEIDEILRLLAKQLGHCGEIANSALTLAIDRSQDIECNPIITLMILKQLATMNLGDMHDTARVQMKIPRSHYGIQMQMMEKMIADYVKDHARHAKL